MEVSKLAEKGVKIKGKSAVFGVNPIGGRAKNVVDAVLLIDRTIPLSSLNIEENPVIFNGPGEYEVKGVKLTGIGRSGEVAYLVKIDSIDTFVIRASTAIKAKDLLKECQVAVIDADAEIEESSLASLNANVVILFGEKSEEIARVLGKTPNKTAKYAISRDKLPSELEVVILE